MSALVLYTPAGGDGTRILWPSSGPAHERWTFVAGAPLLIEELVGYVIGRLGADAYPWPYETTRAPRPIEYAGISLITARVIYRCPVSIGGT